MISPSDIFRRPMIIGDARQNVCSKDREVMEAFSMSCTDSFVLLDSDAASASSEMFV